MKKGFDLGRFMARAMLDVPIIREARRPEAPRSCTSEDVVVRGEPMRLVSYPDGGPAELYRFDESGLEVFVCYAHEVLDLPKEPP